MDEIQARRARLIARLATLTALGVAVTGATGTAAVPAGAALRSRDGSIVRVTGGEAHGLTVAGGYAFRGLPFGAPPVGELRWRAPEPPRSWRGLRDASRYAASCPQPPSGFAGPGPFTEDCLYLNVSTPTLRRDAKRPVLVWIHGGGFTQDASRNYDGSKLAASGIVVVTINYRLGALGFLAHPALASRPGGPVGNYGLMDSRPRCAGCSATSGSSAATRTT